MRATIVDATGRPTLSVEEEFISSFQLGDGDQIVTGEPPGGMPSRCKWINREWVCPIARPSPTHILGPDGVTWEDSETLEDAKASAWSRIKQARIDALNAPLETPYGVFDSDPEARSSIFDAVQMEQIQLTTGLPADIEFTLADNSAVSLSAPAMTQVGLILGAKIQAAHARARELRVMINACTTKVEVGAIQW